MYLCKEKRALFGSTEMDRTPIGSSFQDITRLTLYTTAFAVSFIGWMAPVPTILLTLCCLFASYKRFKASRETELNPVAALMLLFYLYTLSTDIANGIPARSINRTDFQIRLPLLLLSLGFLFKHKGIDTHQALKYHALGSYTTAAVVILTFGWEVCFDFDNLERNPLHIRQCLDAVFASVSHRSYININLLIAMVSLFRWHNKAPTTKRFAILACASAATGGFIFLSGARTSLFSFCVLTGAILLLIVKERASRRQITLLSIASIAGTIGILLSSPRIINLLTSLTKGDATLALLDPRFQIWNCALGIAQAGIPLFGLGSGELQPLLQECYVAQQFEYGEYRTLGAHNQFIEVLVEGGYIGLGLFAALLLSMGLFAKGDRKGAWLGFSVIAINLCFECMLSRSIGAYNIAFLLALSGNNGDETETNKEKECTDRQTRCIIGAMLLAAFIGFIRSNKSKHFDTFQKRFAVVETLPGEVPAEIVGGTTFRIDKTTPSEAWGDMTYMNFFFEELEMKPEETLLFDTYAYVDSAFNGHIVCIKLNERDQKTHSCYYDLVQIGKWQKLNFVKSGLTGSVACGFSIDKHNAKDFSNLNGYVLFCRPNIRKWDGVSPKPAPSTLLSSETP